MPITKAAANQAIVAPNSITVNEEPMNDGLGNTVPLRDTAVLIAEASIISANDSVASDSVELPTLNVTSTPLSGSEHIPNDETASAISFSSPCSYMEFKDLNIFEQLGDLTGCSIPVDGNNNNDTKQSAIGRQTESLVNTIRVRGPANNNGSTSSRPAIGIAIAEDHTVTIKIAPREGCSVSISVAEPPNFVPPVPRLPFQPNQIEKSKRNSRRTMPYWLKFTT